MKVFGAAFNRAMSGRRKKRDGHDDRPFGNPDKSTDYHHHHQGSLEPPYQQHPYFYTSGSVSSSNYYKLYGGPPAAPMGNPYVTRSGQVPDTYGEHRRNRRGSYSSSDVTGSSKPVHQRSRSSSGRFRQQQQHQQQQQLKDTSSSGSCSSSGSSGNGSGSGCTSDEFVWPTSIMPLAPSNGSISKLGRHLTSRSQPALNQQDCCSQEEPIYSEPLPPQPVRHRVSADGGGCDDHIYEYLLKKRLPPSLPLPPPPPVSDLPPPPMVGPPVAKIRNSLSTSPSTEEESTNTAERKRFPDATNASEAVNLQNRLRSLSSGLVGLRNCMPELAAMNHPAPLGEGLGEAGAATGGVRSAVAAFENGRLPTYQNQPAPSSHPSANDEFTSNTLRSAHSHVTEVSSVMTANVSDPASSGGQAAAVQDQGPVVNTNVHRTSCQMSPPQPVSTLQHNYSNIQQPAPLVPVVTRISQTQPSTSPSSQVFASSAAAVPAISNATGESGAFSKSAVRPKTPPALTTNGGDRLRRRERVSADEAARKSALAADVDDLIHLDASVAGGAIDEDSVVRALQARFFNQKYFTNVGPIVLSVNPYRDVGNPLTLTSTKEAASSGCPELSKVVQEAVRMQSESGYPQAIIVSGASGSGKTFASMTLLRKLFEVAAVGGHETDTFKHLAASFTVLRSLCAAKTATNRESSRVGHFIEVQVSDGALYRTKIHCYFLDQSRVVSPLPMEKNYHIFYQMLAGLSQEERSQLGLEGFTVRDLLYLNMGDTRQDEVADAARFADWKSNLAVLGIPFMDVVRVFASILLLGNVEFVSGNGSGGDVCGDEASGGGGYDVEIIGKDELNSVAALLGVSATHLLQGLTSRTHMVRGQPLKSMSDANMCNATRNALAKALYCRTVATIVRRANSLKRPVGPLSGTMSSDSNESQHFEVASHHASTVGTAGSRKSSKSMALLNSAVRHATTDGFIGILDMFGFEDSKPSKLEHLCINLCSETMQHFYNTHIFKSSIESCREEGICSEVSIDYVDNVPCIDLISSLRTGLLSMLDVECSVRGFPDTYVQKVKVQHKENRKLFEPKHCDINRTFGIHHYAGQVVYDTSDFLDTNRDVIPDDLVGIFARSACQFGFATHLFGNEIKALASVTNGASQVARGALFRISPTSASHPDHQLLNGSDEPVSTLTQDFHTRLDNLLRTLVHAKPHFVRCIRPNEHESLTEFDRVHVSQQVRSLQVMETVNLMAKGFPHRMRFRAFNSRYRMLATPMTRLTRQDEKAVDDCEFILDCYSKQASKDHQYKNNHEWAHGRKHVFLSEGARQRLENLREVRRRGAAIKIQAVWRGFHVRSRAAGGRRHTPKRNETRPPLSSSGHVNFRASQRPPRPQPISGTPPPLLPPAAASESPDDKCDFKTIQQTCALFGLDLERPPPVPPSRPYTVTGNKKIAFPQNRVMKVTYPDETVPSEVRLGKGETVVVIGASPRRGHLVVEKRNHTIHVPHSHLELRGNSSQAPPPAMTGATPSNHIHQQITQSHPPLVGIGI